MSIISDKTVYEIDKKMQQFFFHLLSDVSSVSNFILNRIPTDKLTEEACANLLTATRNGDRLTLQK